MENFIKSFGIVFLFCVLCVTAAYSQDKKATYQTVEVTTFEIKPETEFSESMRDVMMLEIVDELMKTKKFSSVKNVGVNETVETAATTDNSAETKPLRITGVVTEYKKGNRTARYLIGFGAGRAKVKAHIKITDAAGKVLLEKDVDGNLVIGAFGGDANGITRGLAKEMAKDIVKKLAK